jgi:hypothetical protein
LFTTDPLWRDLFYDSCEAAAILENVLKIAFEHTNYRKEDLIHKRTNQVLNDVIFPAYLNTHRKIPSIKIRRMAIDISTKYMFHSKKSQTALKTVFHMRLYEKSYLELILVEFRQFTRECWKAWSGLSNRQHSVFTDLERHYFRFDSVWRFEKEVFPLKEMNELMVTIANLVGLYSICYKSDLLRP